MENTHVQPYPDLPTTRRRQLMQKPLYIINSTIFWRECENNEILDSYRVIASHCGRYLYPCIYTGKIKCKLGMWMCCQQTGLEGNWNFHCLQTSVHPDITLWICSNIIRRFRSVGSYRICWCASTTNCISKSDILMTMVSYPLYLLFWNLSMLYFSETELDGSVSNVFFLVLRVDMFCPERWFPCPPNYELASSFPPNKNTIICRWKSKHWNT